jgi:hypothetical protein
MLTLTPAGFGRRAVGASSSVQVGTLSILDSVTSHGCGCGCGRPDKRSAHAGAFFAQARTHRDDRRDLHQRQRAGRVRTAHEQAYDEHCRNVDRTDEHDQTGRYEDMLPQASIRRNVADALPTVRPPHLVQTTPTTVMESAVRNDYPPEGDLR